MKIACLVFGAALASAHSLCAFPFSERLYPDLGRASASGWLWNAETPSLGKGETYLRHVFTLPAEPQAAALRIIFDDAGEVYLNGKRLRVDRSKDEVDAAELSAGLKAGENTLAIHVRNMGGPGGVIYLLGAKLKDGTRFFLHSDEATRAAATAPEGWEQPGFDDSKWSAAKYQADAKSPPWSTALKSLHDRLDRFLTASEKADYIRNQGSLPADFDAGPAPDAKVVYVHNMPKIRLNGKLYDPFWKMYGAGTPWEMTAIRRLADYGCEFVMINCDSSTFEVSPGVYDFSLQEEEAVRALRANPNAKLMFAPILYLLKWLKQHPEEAIAYASGPVDPDSGEHRGRPFRPSAASKAYRAEACACLRAFADWIKSRPWANWVVMIRPCWGTFLEWHTFGMMNGPDVSKPMTEAFHRYAGGKWADAVPPTMEERKTGNFMYDPVRDAKCIDFFTCMQEEVADQAAAFARTIKEYLPGRLVGMWYGYVFTAQWAEGANVLLDRMLSNPDIDYLCDIATYHPLSRRAGGSYLHRTIPATFHRYGKLNVLEDDSRYDWLAGYNRELASICLVSPQESKAVVERNFLSQLFDRCGFQFNDPIPGYGTRPFMADNDAVLEGLAAARRAFRKAEKNVPDDSGLDTAIVVDYRERFYFDAHSATRPGYALYDLAPIYLYRSGTDFDVLSVDDYLAKKKRYAKVVAFNLFHTPAEKAAAFRKELTSDRSRAVQIVVPEYPAADLGKDCERLDTIPVTGEAWARVFRTLGTHLYTAPGNCFRRNGDLLMFCTGEAGRYSITLPEADRGKSWVELLDDANGRPVKGPVLEFESDGPRTWFFMSKR